MESVMKQQDPRRLEPWWNEDCEEALCQEQDAKLRFEKEPSLEASKMFRKIRALLKRKMDFAQHCYAHKMHMAGKYTREYPVSEELVKSKEEISLSEGVKKKKKKKVAKDDGTESEGDNLDLSQDMFPLTHYISSQEELISQVFTIIRGSKLTAMLPPILKSTPLHELKNLCLHELRGMSKKRIFCAINGQDMDGSSESEEEEEIEKQSAETEKKTQNGTSSSLKEQAAENASNKNSANQQALPAYLLKTIKVEAEEDEGSGKKSAAGGKSVLELLELQMRARIIKTMLEKGDDGKALTEDAIAALMGTASEAAQPSNVTSATEAEREATEGDERKYSRDDADRDMEKRKRSRDGRKHRDDGSRRRSSHKKDHHRKRQRSIEPRDSGDDIDKRSRRDKTSEKRMQKKKISRKEFEERMKRAKKNRTYRQRKSSEDEEKANAMKAKETKEEVSEEKPKDVENVENKESTTTADAGKEEGEEEEGEEGGGAVSEKEEGEWDSNEEEEGACSPSDISSGSYYSSARSYSSRSRSRSYSRSYSRSPVRRRGGGYGRGRSRSWTPSRSRSRSRDRRRRDVGKQSKKRTRDHNGATHVKMSTGIVSLPSGGSQKQTKEEEDNWGQSCDIEFVDSEEDFDDNSADAAAKNPNPGTSAKVPVMSVKRPLPMKSHYSERASISFSLQKKLAPSITRNIDLDDLPLKSKKMLASKEMDKENDLELIGKNVVQPDEIINLESPQMISDEILISSDSEQEAQNSVKAKSLRVENREIIHSKGSKNIKNKKSSITSSSTSAGSEKPVSSKDMNIQMSTQPISKKDSDDSKVMADHSDASKACEGNNNAIESQLTNDGNINISTDVANENQVDEARETEGNHDKSEEQFEQKESVHSEIINNVSEEKRVEEMENLGHQDIQDEKTEDASPGNIVSVALTTEPSSGAQTFVQEEKELQADVATAPFSEIVTDEEVNKCGGQRSFSEVEQDWQVKDDSLGNVEGKEVDADHLSIKTKDTSRGKRIKKSQGKKKQKIILEHLQESYVEEPYENKDTLDSSQKEDVSGENTQQDALVAEEINIEKSETQLQTEILMERSESQTETLMEKSESQTETLMEKSEPQTEPHMNENEPLSVIEESESQTDTPGETSNEKDNRNDEMQCEEQPEIDNSKDKPSADDFYRGADELTFSDEETGNGNKDINVISDVGEVEPLRINMGLIRKKVTHKKKIEILPPEKSWTKEKKKREKPIEGIGLLKMTLAESAQTLSKEEDGESLAVLDSGQKKDASDPGNEEDTCTSWGISSVSSREETSLDSRVQSPKGSASQTVDASPISGNEESTDMLSASAGDKKTGQETEIIGVIESCSNPDINSLDEDIDLGGSSWSMRWLQSEKVQKVVSSSKMLSRVRKKIQKKDKATKVVTTEKPVIQTQKLPEPVVPIIGSIEEYERLFGMKAKSSVGEATTSVEATQESTSVEQAPDGTQESQQPKEKRPVFGSDDEGEDSEEEALWSKILGK